MLSLTVDALGLLALYKRNRLILLPWLIWYIIDMGELTINYNFTVYHHHTIQCNGLNREPKVKKR
jgi:hypothetical protein